MADFLNGKIRHPNEKRILKSWLHRGLNPKRQKPFLVQVQESPLLKFGGYDYLSGSLSGIHRKSGILLGESGRGNRLGKEMGSSPGWTPKSPFTKWFPGGRLNTCFNAVDVHVLQGRGNQTAVIYDSPVTNTIKKFTFNELKDRVSRIAGFLKGLGVQKKGTRSSSICP